MAKYKVKVGELIKDLSAGKLPPLRREKE